MATPSEVKAGLDDAAQEIRTARRALQQSKARVATAASDLAAIPSKYADMIQTINGYDGSDTFEMLAQAELAKISQEFNALEVKANDAVTALQSIDFSS